MFYIFFPIVSQKSDCRLQSYIGTAICLDGKTRDEVIGFFDNRGAKFLLSKMKVCLVERSYSKMTCVVVCNCICEQTMTEIKFCGMGIP